MTMSPGEIDRKVRQHDNDIEAIYEILDRISTEQDRQLHLLEALDVKIDGVEERLTARIDGLEGRFDALEGRFDALEGRFDALEGRFDALEGRFDGVEATLVEVLRRLPEAS